MAARHLSTRLLAQLGHRPAWCSAPAALQLVSWLSTSAKTHPDATELAKQLRANQLAEEVVLPLAQTTSAVPHSHLLQLAQQQAGLSGEAAEDAINRLERAGQLLSLAGTVVLRPGDIAHALNLVLPSSPDATEARLGEVRTELAGLHAQQAAVGRRAAWRQRGFVWAGLGSQLALWGLLFRLTYYELSWDVMEPVCFFVGGFQAVLAYAFFMIHKQEFAWDTALERYVGRWEAGALRRAGFDTQRYDSLKREERRLGDLLAAQRQRQAEEEAAAAAAAEGAEAEGDAAAEAKKEA